jgi:hypothetical protein
MSTEKFNCKLCKYNILANINLFVKKYKPEICAFQETAKYESIIELFDNSVYEHYLNKSGPEYMLTIWNKRTYALIDAYHGEFERGRPFAIIILQKAKSVNYIAVINIHAGHIINTHYSIFKIINNFINENITDDIKNNVSRIIMAGDFNRNVNKDLTSDYKIKFTKEFKLRSLSNYEYTCCDMGYAHTKNYDHVLDSKFTPVDKYLGIESSKYKVPASDHVLVMVKLKH